MQRVAKKHSVEQPIETHALWLFYLELPVKKLQMNLSTAKERKVQHPAASLQYTQQKC